MAKYETCRAYAESTDEGKKIEEAYADGIITREQREGRYHALIEEIHSVGACEAEAENGPPVKREHLPVPLGLGWLMEAHEEGYRLKEYEQGVLGALIMAAEPGAAPTDVLVFSRQYGGPSVRLSLAQDGDEAILINGKVERMTQEVVNFLNYLLSDLEADLNDDPAEFPGGAIVWL